MYYNMIIAYRICDTGNYEQAETHKYIVTV